MPVYVESSILEMEKIWLNGGRRGFLVSIDPKVLTELLAAKAVQCASVD
jgi:prolyl-tRNA editing enzyme YbaK/EbsC (Cys-tRNA(Pro) deacylase)